MTQVAKGFETTCNAAAGTGSGLSNEAGERRGMEPNFPRLFHPIHHERDAGRVTRTEQPFMRPDRRHRASRAATHCDVSRPVAHCACTRLPSASARSSQLPATPLRTRPSAWYKIGAIRGHLAGDQRVSIVTPVLLAAEGASFRLARYAHPPHTELLHPWSVRPERPMRHRQWTSGVPASRY
ncbi:hypothetical protein GCM10009608_28910 [Pseudonocardia alaniniphila]